MKPYHQYCAVAKALDVVGERWTLLIVRELLTQGACRFTDLREGLPGIATNLLTERLRDLEAAGMIERFDAPPPVSATVYRLTDRGRELQPVLRSLGQFGLQYMVDATELDKFRSNWFAYPVDNYLHDRTPELGKVTITLVTDQPTVHVVIDRGRVYLERGAADPSDLTLRGEPRLIIGLLAGVINVNEARIEGLDVTGDEGVLERVGSLGLTHLRERFDEIKS